MPFPTRIVFNQTFEEYSPFMQRQYMAVRAGYCGFVWLEILSQAYQFFGKMVLAPICLAHFFTALVCYNMGNLDRNNVCVK